MKSKKERQRIANKKYRDSHPEKEQARQKARTRKESQWFWDYKSTLSCFKCGVKHPAIIDFHHIDPTTKEFRFNGAVSALNRVLKELKKCIPLCSNCHRILHYEMKKKTITLMKCT